MPPPSPSDDSVLGRLIAEHFDGLFRYLRRLGVPPSDVEDAIQEVAARAATRLGGVEPARHRAFAYGVAFRVASEWRRTAHREIADDTIDAIDGQGLDPEASWDDKWARALLDRIIREMPMELRAVFVLYEVEEHTMAEIADELELPPGTVASRLRRARAAFEEAVAREERTPHPPRGDALAGTRSP
jgi:RNA polymerase sigma-70 factor, ECF subfamily